MRVLLSCIALVLTLLPISLAAQQGTSPVLSDASVLTYPPIARAAHVSGKVEVHFTINSDGTVSSVQSSGPEMLRISAERQISDWRFETPLPMSAQRDFVVTLQYGVSSADDVADDDLDTPPYVPCCGDVISLPASETQVTGTAKSADDKQAIDISRALTARVANRCPSERATAPPIKTGSDDFIELMRLPCEGESCIAYRVKVHRDGLVEWSGEKAVAVKGAASARISTEAADALFQKFQSTEFWRGCSAKLPATNEDERNYSLTFLRVSIGGQEKIIDAYSSFTSEDAGSRLVWAIDKAADTHRWRHVAASDEPMLNMNEDLSRPKPGITALMRATDHYTRANAQRTVDPLKRLIAGGADVNAEDESGWTALMYAAYFDSALNLTVPLLIEAHADVNHRSIHGDTALMFAAYQGELNEALLKAGADINNQNRDGVTALMLLAQHLNDTGEVREALAAGADARAVDRQGRTAVDYLDAASCDKAIIVLPPRWMTLGSDHACPYRDESYKQTRALLLTAMKPAKK